MVYLGSKTTSNGKSSQELKQRTEKTAWLTKKQKRFKSKNLRLSIKTKEMVGHELRHPEVTHNIYD